MPELPNFDDYIDRALEEHDRETGEPPAGDTEYRCTRCGGVLEVSPDGRTAECPGLADHAD